jgi:hypothetical protein
VEIETARIVENDSEYSHPIRCQQSYWPPNPAKSPDRPGEFNEVVLGFLRKVMP